ncbi:MAG: VOC family protein [Clostridia bacterium]|nr:VOC family protein [Clostridia bacterium]
MGFTLAHVGLNGIDASDAQTIARAFSALLGLPHRPQPASHFAGSLVEVMSGGGRGAHGHIGFGTDDLPRAMYFASRAGFAFDPDSRKDDALGNPLLYYLKNEIAGFGIHLLQKERGTPP